MRKSFMVFYKLEINIETKTETTIKTAFGNCVLKAETFINQMRFKKIILQKHSEYKECFITGIIPITLQEEFEFFRE